MSLDHSLLIACWSSSFPADEVGGILFCKTAHDFKPTSSVITEWHIFFLWSISQFLAAVIEVTKMFSSLNLFWFVFGLVCFGFFFCAALRQSYTCSIFCEIISRLSICYIAKSKVTGKWISHQPWGRMPRWGTPLLTLSHPHMMVLVRCLFERAPCSLRSCQPLWAQPPSLPQLPLPLPDPAAIPLSPHIAEQ